MNDNAYKFILVTKDKTKCLLPAKYIVGVHTDKRREGSWIYLDKSALAITKKDCEYHGGLVDTNFLTYKIYVNEDITTIEYMLNLKG